ncbi:MAG: DeoR/GlpR family DNA-binding transcription regulator [Eubacteriales bacterium]|nr:DeoR/GlpR family DNA-binding transcription regulator [Eubacteriales bacterium]
MLALERRNLILEKLQDEKKVVVSELSALYEVSEETIRRDLEKLEQDGYATKSYGGAVLNENVGFDMPLTFRSRKNVGAKQRIGEIAAGMIHDGDHIMLDASSTALFIAKAIKSKQKITVVTNSVEIILELSEVPGFQVICTGGTVKSGYLAMLGSDAEDFADRFYVDKCFISCKALDMHHGVMDSVPAFASMKKKALDSCAKSFLVLDSSKFDRTSFVQIGKLDSIDYVVTEKRPSDEWMEFFASKNIECIYEE